MILVGILSSSILIVNLLISFDMISEAIKAIVDAIKVYEHKFIENKRNVLNER